MARATVIYDADCGCCKFSLALLLSWDRPRKGRGRREPGARALRPLPLGTAEADRLLADLTEEQRDASWHLVIDGRRHSAGAALAPALGLLPRGGRPAALLARFPHATEWGYR